MAKKTFIYIFLFPFLSLAQNDEPQIPPPTHIELHESGFSEIGIKVPTTIYEGDTIPLITLPPVVCYANRVFKNYKKAMQWDRIKYNVKKVYPYAILAAAKLKEYEYILSKMPKESDRKAYTKMVEKQLKDQFSDELKDLSINQGRILMKLINRQTSKTTYQIVKDMRGSFTAFMWQSVAVLFDSSLKVDYDSEGEDKAIEQAVKLIENGDL